VQIVQVQHQRRRFDVLTLPHGFVGTEGFSSHVVWAILHSFVFLLLPTPVVGHLLVAVPVKAIEGVQLV